VAQEAERVKNHFALIEQERTEFNEVCALVQAFQLRKDEVDLITHDCMFPSIFDLSPYMFKVRQL
jgi:hypothetical protein